MKRRDGWGDAVMAGTGDDGADETRPVAIFARQQKILGMLARGEPS
jgi:hypothetical protein